MGKKSGWQKIKDKQSKKNLVALCAPLTKYFSAQPSASTSGQLDTRPAKLTKVSGTQLVANVSMPISEDDASGSGEEDSESDTAEECSDDGNNDDDVDERKDIDTGEDSDGNGDDAAHVTAANPSHVSQENDLVEKPAETEAGMRAEAPPEVSTDLLNTKEQYPTDPFFHKDKPLTPQFIRALIEHGPCQPGLRDGYDAFPCDEEKRRFRPVWYKRTIGQSSCTVDRYWLVYSPKCNRMFCFCCWMFGKSAGRQWAKPAQGVSNWRKGVERIEQHENSAAHREAEKMLLMARFRISKDSTVVSELLKAEREQIERNRRILHRLIDSTLFLARQNLAFRGHREYAGLGAPSSNEGNFLELLKLMAQYDALLEEHMRNPATRKVTYLSPDSQNELISALASETLSSIVTEVKAAKFYSVIVDSTIDISSIDQFSLSLRYVTKTGNSIERFIQFEELQSSNADAFYNVLVNALNSLGLDVKLIRGQAYDGARTMSGHLSGLQTRVKQQCSEKAFYVHCCAHNLNLILLDAACSMGDAKLFFGTLESLYCFLTSSLPRFKILEEEQANMQLEETILTLKRLSDTRWASRKQATESVIQSLPAIAAALERIKEHDHTSPKTAAEADGLLHKISTFEFKLMLCIWNAILQKTYILSNYLQKSSIDINTAVQLIDTCMAQLNDMRTDTSFEEMVKTAQDMARRCSTGMNGTEFAEVRGKKRKTFHDEQAEDEVIRDAKTRFRVQFYFIILDTMVQQFEKRFRDFRQIAALFSVLNPKNFSSHDAVVRIENLANFYAGDVSTSDQVVNEFRSFRALCNELDIQLCTTAVLPFLISNDMDRAFPSIAILYRIYGTLPVTSANAERSFSRLKLIKNYLRASMKEARLSNLALLSIEKDIAIDKEKVADRFARMKERKMALFEL
uniref:TTF-type domain-containing protein n=1 Tax=Myripristis murdjan TaxID=586833 RepID=A0A667Y992_9TELE